MVLELCPCPALYPYYKKENDTVIVVDVFRASATICAMLQNGASAVIPVAGTEEAKQYKLKGYLVGAERNTRKCDFADFGNSPSDYTVERVSGKEVVFTTTNGTQAVQAAKDSRKLFIGTFSNIDAVLAAALETERETAWETEMGNKWETGLGTKTEMETGTGTILCLDSTAGWEPGSISESRPVQRIVILCAGWENRINIEDTLFGGAFAEKLSEKTGWIAGSDSIRIAMELWRQAKDNPLEYLKQSDHYVRLITNGVASDAAWCLQMNTVSVVPCYNKKENRLKI